MASWSFGNLSSSCRDEQSAHFSSDTAVLCIYSITLCFSFQCTVCIVYVRYLRAVVAAVLDDPLHLLVNQLHTAKTGLLQTLHLPFHQQLKGNLRHE